jgi:predicted nucleotidyltransferase component of viral defense system
VKDYVLELVGARSGFNAKMNTMREYLQACILRIMHDEGIFRSTAFLGGTALRFLYKLPRFSEYLDFSLTSDEQYEFVSLVATIKRELQLAGYDITISYNDEKTVQYAMIRFENLMYDAGLAPRKTQKFSIRIEIDTNPPTGAALTTDIVNIYFPISFLTYDIPSLFAGKVHALLSRRYTKGRDFYDLGWYLSRWKDLVPNIRLLHNALNQSGWKGEVPSVDTWRSFLYNVVEKSDWQKVRQDVENFLENPSEMNIYTQEKVLSLIEWKR